MMTSGHTRIPKKTLFTCFLLMGFILLLCPHTITSQLQFAFTRTFQIPLEFGRRIPLAARTTSMTAMVSQERYDQLLQEKQQLENYLANITAQLHQEQAKVTQLVGVHQTLDSERMDYLPAFVIADIDRHQLILDRGAHDHIQPGQFIIADNAIIGSVSEVSGHQARVLLVTHPDSRIPVIISPSGAQGLLTGIDRRHMRIQLIKKSLPVSIGDSVFIQIHPGLLTTRMIVGKIASCKSDDQDPLLWDIVVDPVKDMSHITNVHVIVIKTPKTTKP